MASEDRDDRDAYEEKNVHEVYQQIAKHFSATRYKVCSPAIGPPCNSQVNSAATAMAHRGTFSSEPEPRCCWVGCRMWQRQVLAGE